MRAGGGKLFQNAISAFFSPVKRREVRKFYIKTDGKFARSCRSPLQPAELRQKKRAAAHKTITLPEDSDRTGVFDGEIGWVYAGCGIVEGSVADDEYDEIGMKLKTVLSAFDGGEAR